MHQFQIEVLERLIEILSALAAKGRTITYKELALALGLPVSGLNRGTRSELIQLLDWLIVFCLKCDMPLLPLCVVRGNTRQPGDGLGLVLHALNVASEAEWGDPVKRKQLVKAEQQRAQQYFQRAKNDNHFVRKALGS